MPCPGRAGRNSSGMSPPVRNPIPETDAVRAIVLCDRCFMRAPQQMKESDRAAPQPGGLRHAALQRQRSLPAGLTSLSFFGAFVGFVSVTGRGSPPADFIYLS